MLALRTRSLPDTIADFTRSSISERQGKLLGFESVLDTKWEGRMDFDERVY